MQFLFLLYDLSFPFEYFWSATSSFTLKLQWDVSTKFDLAINFDWGVILTQGHWVWAAWSEVLKWNIAKGTTDPGVDYFNQLLWFGLVDLV